MTVETKINGYYRTILSSINENNSRETNLMLLKEVIEASPKLLKSACEVIHSGQIAKVVFAPNQRETSQCFYSIPSIDGTKQYLIMKGFCSCKLLLYHSICIIIMIALGYQFAENVLVRESAFTCKHELACIILEYMGTDLGKSAESLLHSVEELDEEDYLERMHLISDI
ncbi:hypothetical protein X943_003528 [Babesia divergens]|uniref:SWIM-type domain-containing protein n=1 Tax=Babesia divergens TaxID=32595 RepID=A0AAD9LLD5_BABDI|nr:hypothetical protein X943_003528 [Babesia divergens]